MSFVEIIKKKTIVLICLTLILITGGLGVLGVFEDVDNSIYDVLLRFAPEPAVAEEVVFVDVEDLSLDEMFLQTH